MALRDLVGGAARLSAGMWKEVANVIDPQPIADPVVADPEPAEPAVVEAQDQPSAEAPPGTMLVPIDSWTRVLEQLGNLHQAGQDLAEARERAAKAETEAKFLREQLAEARAKKKAPPKSKAKPKAAPTPKPARVVADEPPVPSRAEVARANVIRARRRASDWLKPRD